MRLDTFENATLSFQNDVKCVAVGILANDILVLSEIEKSSIGGHIFKHSFIMLIELLLEEGDISQAIHKHNEL